MEFLVEFCPCSDAKIPSKLTVPFKIILIVILFNNMLLIIIMFINYYFLLKYIY
jgi:hypothetical protein